MRDGWSLVLCLGPCLRPFHFVVIVYCYAFSVFLICSKIFTSVARIDQEKQMG